MKMNRVSVQTQPGHTGDTTAVKLSMGFSVSYTHSTLDHDAFCSKF